MARAAARSGFTSSARGCSLGGRACVPNSLRAARRPACGGRVPRAGGAPIAEAAANSRHTERHGGAPNYPGTRFRRRGRRPRPSGELGRALARGRPHAEDHGGGGGERHGGPEEVEPPLARGTWWLGGGRGRHGGLSEPPPRSQRQHALTPHLRELGGGGGSPRLVRCDHGEVVSASPTGAACRLALGIELVNARAAHAEPCCDIGRGHERACSAIG